MNTRILALVTASLLTAATSSADTARWPVPAPSCVPDSAAQDGWEISGNARTRYCVTEDPAVTRAGHPTLRLAPTSESGGYATFMRLVDAEPLVGKRIRITAFLRTEGASGRANIWARVTGRTAPRNPALQSDVAITLPADSDWQRHELLVDVEPAHQLHHGVGLDGPGRLWIDEPTLEVVGDIPPPPPPAPPATR